MPTDLIQRVRPALDCIYLPFLVKALDVLAECRTLGVEYWAIRGYDNWVAQAKLYFQGRTTPGPVVTNAGPGFSAHNYGLALDVCRDVNVERSGLQPGWGSKDYDILGEVALGHGLVWGGTWSHPDKPHIQWPGYVDRKQIEPLRAKWLAFDKALTDQERLKQIWAHIEGAQ